MSAALQLRTVAEWCEQHHVSRLLNVTLYSSTLSVLVGDSATFDHLVRTEGASEVQRSGNVVTVEVGGIEARWVLDAIDSGEVTP